MIVLMLLVLRPRVMVVIWKSVGFFILDGSGVEGFFENINIRPRWGGGILYIHIHKILYKLTTALNTIRQQARHLGFIPIEWCGGQILCLGFQIRGFFPIQIASIGIVFHIDALSTRTAGSRPIAG